MDRMETQNSPWYLLSGLIIGFILGYVLTLLINPYFYNETSPDQLNSFDKDAYRLLIAEAYSANSDLTRANSRLELLHDTDKIQALSTQAQQSLGINGNENSARALAALANALQNESSP